MIDTEQTSSDSSNKVRRTASHRSMKFATRIARRPARISSSKYVAEQRAKARDIVQCLQCKNIRLVAIDFDKTLLSIHTNGDYRGTLDSLLDSFRSTFHYLIQAILDTPAFGRTLHLCIVSFTSQQKLIEELLRLAFPTS
jgi:hypothetical protein